MLYELRVYDAMPGKLPALNARFAGHTVGFFKDHGIGILGFWTAEIGASNQLTYILSFDSMADREKKWAAFGADKRWQEVRAETEKDGPLVSSLSNTFMRLTPYSMEPGISSNVQEMRAYHAMPGKLPALNDRFANHTINLFKKHGMENVGYWTEDVGTSNKLVYMLGYAGLGDREKSWAAFGADPDWQKARAASEVDGPLVRQSVSTILRRTDYSPK
jgi:hypothetical protein